MNDWINRERFSLHPGVRMAQTMIKTMEDHLGEPRGNWKRWLESVGVKDRSLVKGFLVQKLKMGNNQARLFEEVAFGEAAARYDAAAYFEAVDDFIKAQYAGPKEGLRSLYSKCIEILSSFGPDVRFCPCKTFVPAYREKVFAQILPAAQSRIDLGLALGDTEGNDLLLTTGGREKGDRITHKIKISQLSQLNEDVVNWARRAYENI